MKILAVFGSFVLGVFVGLLYADVVNVIILKTIPLRKPRELEPDPYAVAWGSV